MQWDAEIIESYAFNPIFINQILAPNNLEGDRLLNQTIYTDEFHAMYHLLVCIFKQEQAKKFRFYSENIFYCLKTSSH